MTEVLLAFAPCGFFGRRRACLPAGGGDARESRGAWRFDPDRARSRFLDTFSPEHTRAVMADGIRVGFFVVKPRDEGLVLEHLYVRPSHQGRGIGAAVLRAVFAEADADGLDVRVGALKGSDANRFYRRHGFMRQGEAQYDIYYVRRTGPSGP